MRNKLLLIATLLTLSCVTYLFFNKSSINASQRIFIQAIPNSLVLKNIIESLSGKINAIIKEELNVDQHNELDFFSPKKAQRLTLYYINDVQQNTNDIIIAALDCIKMNNFVAHNISIKTEVEFFGGPFGYNDELVILINDPNKELSSFNQSIKTAMHQANNEYNQMHHKNLYDIAKSERYPYMPHIGLGRVRSNSIKNQLKDQSRFPILFERIQSRIKDATLEYVKNQLTLHNNKIVYDKIVIFDVNKQEWIKEYILSFCRIDS